MSNEHRIELVEHIGRSRSVVAMLRDPDSRKTVEDLVAYLETTLQDMDIQAAMTPAA
jgi:hypothetical protein